MKILLTGSHGFIGSHYHEYIKNDHEVICMDKLNGFDLCDPTVVNDIPDCDMVIHMAATNGTRLFYETPTEVTFNNTLPTFNLINRFRGSNTKFVFTSTCEIFNGVTDKGLYPIPTDEGVPIMFEGITNPRWSYSIPKALGENLIANCGLDWVVIRYFNVYGPKQKDHFISEFVERVINNEFYITGNDTRSFCYINDAVKITDLIANACSCEIVNIGNSEEVKIELVAKMILDIMGVDPNKLRILPSPTGSAKRRCPSTKRLKQVTKFNNYTPLKIGLTKTIEYILNEKRNK